MQLCGFNLRFDIVSNVQIISSFKCQLQLLESSLYFRLVIGLCSSLNSAMNAVNKSRNVIYLC